MKCLELQQSFCDWKNGNHEQNLAPTQAVTEHVQKIRDSPFGQGGVSGDSRFSTVRRETCFKAPGHWGLAGGPVVLRNCAL